MAQKRSPGSHRLENQLQNSAGGWRNGFREFLGIL